MNPKPSTQEEKKIGGPYVTPRSPLGLRNKLFHGKVTFCWTTEKEKKENLYERLPNACPCSEVSILNRYSFIVLMKFQMTFLNTCMSK